jgi:hypothetical protein
MKYRFRFQSTRGLKYLWLALLSPLLVILMISWLNVRESLLVAFLTLIPFAAAFYLFARKGRAFDEITVDDKGLTSAYFGRIEYATIEKVDGSGFTRTPPSLKLQLRSGRSVTWLLSHRGSVFNTREDAAIFSLFTEVLKGKMSKKEAFEKYTSYSTRIPSPAAQLEKAVQQNRKKQQWFIPVLLALVILIFMRTCGK